MESNILARYEVASSYMEVKKVDGSKRFFAVLPNAEFDKSAPPSDNNPEYVQSEITEAEYVEATRDTNG